MISARTAEENLARIRSLMERSTLYRTVSVPGAAWGGALSVGAWAVSHRLPSGEIPDGKGFLGLWLLVLVLTAAGNLFFLSRESRQKGSPTFSSGLWSAGRSLCPAFFCAGFFTVIGAFEEPLVQVAVWIFFYGLGLLATQHFAPRSIIVLGWLFLLTPLVGIGLLYFDKSMSLAPLLRNPSALMALTFGGYHLGYALIVYLLERKDGPGKEGAADGL